MSVALFRIDLTAPGSVLFFQFCSKLEQSLNDHIQTHPAIPLCGLQTVFFFSLKCRKHYTASSAWQVVLVVALEHWMVLLNFCRAFSTDLESVEKRAFFMGVHQGFYRTCCWCWNPPFPGTLPKRSFQPYAFVTPNESSHVCDTSLSNADITKQSQRRKGEEEEI